MGKYTIENNGDEYTVTDTVNVITCTFLKGKFKDTYKMEYYIHENTKPIAAQELAKIVNDFVDWLIETHGDIL